MLGMLFGLGASTGARFGAGAQVLLPAGLFAQVEAERSRKVGQRVFVFNGQVFPLGIKAGVTVTPITISGGVPYAKLKECIPYGGGLGIHLFKESSDFADADENTNMRALGHHVLGGVESQFSRWVGAAVEIRYTRVPKAFSNGGVAAEFAETDLGGTSVRVKVLIGR